MEHLSSRETKTPVVSEWGIYEDLHVVQDGAPPQFVPFVRERFGNHFHVWWIGRRGITKWPPCDLLAVGPRTNLPIKAKAHTW